MANGGMRQRPASISPLVHDMSTASAIAIAVAINTHKDAADTLISCRFMIARQRTPLESCCLCKSALCNNTRNRIAPSRHRYVIAAQAALIRIRLGRVFCLEQRASHAFPRLLPMVSIAPRVAGPAPASHGSVGRRRLNSRLWYRAIWCDALTGDRAVLMLTEHFADVLGAAGWPDGACLFLRGDRTARKGSRGDDGAVSKGLFFSPVAIAVIPHLIALCDAKPSPPPARAGATLLVGKQNDWDLLPHELH